MTRRCLKVITPNDFPKCRMIMYEAFSHQEITLKCTTKETGNSLEKTNNLVRYLIFAEKTVNYLRNFSAAFILQCNKNKSALHTQFSLFREIGSIAWVGEEACKKAIRCEIYVFFHRDCLFLMYDYTELLFDAPLSKMGSHTHKIQFSYPGHVQPRVPNISTIKVEISIKTCGEKSIQVCAEKYHSGLG